MAAAGRLSLVVLCTVLVGTVPFVDRGRDGSLERVRREHGLRIGYAVEAPYAFVDARGEVTGESPETARRVAAAIGATEPTWVQTQFERLIPELETGRFDVIAAGLFVTAERARRVAFSRPTFRVGPALLVRDDRPSAPGSCSEATLHPTLRLAVIRGSVEEEQLHACGLGAEQIVDVPDLATGRSAVLDQVVDGLVLSAPTLRWTARVSEHLRAIPFTLPSSVHYGAFAFRRGDRALRVAWDDALSRHLASPAHAREIAAFGFGLEERSDRASLEEVLGR